MLDEALEEQGDALAAQFGSQFDLKAVWGYIEKAIAAAKRSPLKNSSQAEPADLPALVALSLGVRPPASKRSA
jgi:hypothetical protein